MKKNGFTLVELLIVLVVLGILAAAVIPQMMEQAALDKEALVQAQMESVQSELESFLSVNSRYPESMADHDDFQFLYLRGLVNPLSREGRPVRLMDASSAIKPQDLYLGQVMAVVDGGKYTIWGMGPRGLLPPIHGGFPPDFGSQP